MATSQWHDGKNTNTIFNTCTYKLLMDIEVNDLELAQKLFKLMDKEEAILLKLLEVQIQFQQALADTGTHRGAAIDLKNPHEKRVTKNSPHRKRAGEALFLCCIMPQSPRLGFVGLPTTSICKGLISFIWTPVTESSTLKLRD